MHIRVMSFKAYEKGSLLGFFTLGYGGLSIQNCRLMTGKNGGSAWFAFPQIKGEQDGEIKYFDILHLSNPEREAVRALVMAELQAQGHLKRNKPRQQPQQRRFEREKKDLDEYYTSNSPPSDDDIPF